MRGRGGLGVSRQSGKKVSSISAITNWRKTDCLNKKGKKKPWPTFRSAPAAGGGKKGGGSRPLVKLDGEGPASPVKRKKDCSIFASLKKKEGELASSHSVVNMFGRGCPPRREKRN